MTNVPIPDYLPKFRLLLSLLILTWLVFALVLLIGNLGGHKTQNLAGISHQNTGDIAQLQVQYEMLTNKIALAETRLEQITKEMNLIVETYMPHDAQKKLEDGRASLAPNPTDGVSSLPLHDPQADIIASIASNETGQSSTPLPVSTPITIRKFEPAAFQATAPLTAEIPVEKAQTKERPAVIEKPLSKISDLSEVKQKNRANDMVVSAVKLRDAVYGSKRFTSELSVFKRLASSEPQLNDNIATLEKYAEQGITPLNDLQRDFNDIAQRITNISRKTTIDPTLLDRAALKLSGLVDIRKIAADGTGNTAEDILARTQKALEREDLITSTRELKTLPADMLPLAQDWIAKAEAITTSKTATDNIFSYVMESAPGKGDS